MVELARRKGLVILVCPGPSKQLCKQQAQETAGSRLLDLIQGSA